MYRVVYISGWPASDGRPELLQWANDIPDIVGATVCTSLFPFAPTLGLTSCHVVNNSAAISWGESLRSSRCVFAV
jgi:hypothetical protein